MKKSDKKIENAIRESLTEVCEVALKDIDGFQWITHLVNFNHFPKSLSVVCVFGSDEAIARVLSDDNGEYMYLLIKERLGAVNIHIKDIHKQVSFTTEAAWQKK